MVSVALTALIGIQLFWVRHAYALREEQMNRQVTTILSHTAKQVEQKTTCFELFGKIYIKPHQGFYVAKQQWRGQGDFVPVQEHAPDSMRMFFVDEDNDSLYNFNNIKFNHSLEAEVLMKCEYIRDTAVEPSYGIKDNAIQPISKATFKDFQDRFRGRQSIDKIIDVHYLDSVLKHNMVAAGIRTGYHYGLVKASNDSVEYISKGSDPKKVQRSVMKANLLDDKYFHTPYNLSIYFDHPEKMLLSSLWGMLVISGLIILMLSYAFWYFIRTILKQKKLSEMKTDFINNMTHEFKTPITNIALALETLRDNDDVEEQKKNIFLSIITDENNRMRENVERILQIAVIDKEEMDLQKEPVDIHRVIKRVVECTEAPVNGRKPQIDCRLEAYNAIMQADETHIVNVLYNLLDNAMKYNAGQPHITISTKNEGDELILTVEDNGIGMDAETQRRLFEKFYRAHTGNVHNVKGFGLGLSYVKSIVDAHQGRIQVRSEKGKGSSFEINFPNTLIVV
jgi:two-component system phosphate regulon sensor histidine kinase PhoR